MQKMNSNPDLKFSRAQTTTNLHGGPNWVLIAGGALLSTLSIRLGCKLKVLFVDKRTANATTVKGRRHINNNTRSGACQLHSNAYCFTYDEDGCCHCFSDAPEGCVETKHASRGAFSRESDLAHGQLAAVASVSPEAPNAERVTASIWAVSPERVELPRRSFHQSSGSDSPCASESGSDLFSKREVVHRLRQQLKRRDEIILEMQGQITEQQKLVSERMRHDVNLQSQLDAANRALFAAEREIQRLRKVIADYCASGYATVPDDQVVSGNGELQNGYVNGVVGEMEVRGWSTVGMLMIDGEGEADGRKVMMLKKEVEELREILKEKDYFLQSHKEHKMELCSKVKELQFRLDSQVPNIL